MEILYRKNGKTYDFGAMRCVTFMIQFNKSRLNRVRNLRHGTLSPTGIESSDFFIWLYRETKRKKQWAVFSLTSLESINTLFRQNCNGVEYGVFLTRAVLNTPLSVCKDSIL
jgi:hypothetical protein